MVTKNDYERCSQMKGLKDFLDCFKKAYFRAGGSERFQAPKPKSRVNKVDGPMVFLGEQIVKKMEQAGWPAFIHCSYRSPDKQNEMFVKGRSKAKAWQSPHQYLEAVDIVHKTKYWQVSASFWEALAAAVKAVEADYGVDLVHGHYWRFTDSAHIELKDWRKVRKRQQKLTARNYRPNMKDLEKRFNEVLPNV